MNSYLDDLRHAIRALRRTPAFTITAVLTLGLAIGANASIFSLLNALVFRPLPVPNPDQLVSVSTVFRSGQEAPLSLPMFRELTDRQRVLSSVIGWWGDPILGIEAKGTVVPGDVIGVTGNFHAELGALPSAGRLIVPSDVDLDTFTGSTVAVLGYGFWQRQFGGDPAVIGSTIRVQGAPLTVVGVGPRGFKGFGLLTEPDVTVPLTTYPLIFRGYNMNVNAGNLLWMKMAARLRPGVTFDQGRAQLESIWPAIKADVIPPTHAGLQRDNFLAIRLKVESLATGQELYLRPKFTRPLYFLLGIAVVVLLIACVNLASMMLPRVISRAHDLTLRNALGASAWRAARPILVEGVLISAAGALLGVSLAYWASGAIARVMLPDSPVPISFHTSPDLRVLALTAITSIAAGLLAALVPAWIGARRELRHSLQHHQRTLSASTRLGKVLVASQVALSVVLLTNAGLFVRSWQYVLGIDPGYAVDAKVAHFQTRPEANRPPEIETYYPVLLDRMAMVPGVERASISQLAVGMPGLHQPVSSMAADPGDGISAVFNAVTPGFFRSLDIPIVQGRDFTWTDRARGRRVAIVSQALARRLFPTSSAIGQRIRIGTQPYRQDLEVVGVTADPRLYDVKDPLPLSVYIAAVQNVEPMVGGNLYIRGRGFDETVLKRTVESLGFDYVTDVRSLAELIDIAQIQDRMAAAIAEFFGALAVMLSAMGVGGLVAYGVSRRAREIAIRIALGADRSRIVRSVLAQGVIVTVIGAAVGLVAGVGSSHWIHALLVGVSSSDPVVLIGIPAVLLIAAVIACVLPAYRAATVDPAGGLRTE